MIARNGTPVARLEGLTIVSCDPIFERYAVAVLRA